ncbi:MAG: aminoacyl-histidine dipeptidase [Clostridia bacterium]|nr:aminoacyl-histidine dipeptidase [Clostridia bacterium]
MRVLQGLEPTEVFRYFEQICAIPHPSGHPRQIGDFCARFAEAHGLRYIRDGFGNLIIFKDGDPNKAPVILQGHLDMVCVKEPDVQIDFLRDGLPLCTDGEFIFSRGTSLGADDGIAVAMILAILAADTKDLPPIEAVFTMDEETSMRGAAGLDVSVLRGRRMINLDSEAEGVLWVSCAGGERVTIRMQTETEAASAPCFAAELTGLCGGHSGTEIDKGRQNAVLATAKLLRSVPQLRLCSLSGGKVDNAIPAECTAVFCGSPDALRSAFEHARCAWEDTEPNARLSVRPTDAQPALNSQNTAAVLDLLDALPNGVQAFSREIEGLVETSLNLGVCRIGRDGAELHYSVRSSVDAAREALVKRITETAASFGASSRTSGGYPAWQYRKDSPLRETAVQAFTALTGRAPSVEAIHAGLECGLFCGKLPDLDCISMGPDIFDIHSPSERLSAASVARTYALVWDILKRLR